MQIVDIAIDDLKPYENNPRNNDGAVQAVAESIKQFGFKVPIVIDKENIIVAGHTRYKAAMMLGLETVPAIRADDLTDEQVQAFRLADNKTAELAEWDFEKLNAELAALADFDMSAFGFEQISNDGADVSEDDVPEPDDYTEPQTQLGDIYQLGAHRLICGDSTDSAVLEKLTEGAEIDLIITDPPYNVDYSGKVEMLNDLDPKKATRNTDVITNDKLSDSAFYQFLFDVFTNLFQITKPGGAAYVFHASMESANFINAFKAAGFKHAQNLVWAKNIHVLGMNDYQWKHEPIIYGWKEGAGHYFTDSRAETTVIDDSPNINQMSKAELKAYIKELLQKEPASTVIRDDKPQHSVEHPTMKPVKLVAYLMQNSSKAGEKIIDPFGGSGSTLIACEQTGRICYTSELSPKYCDVIIKRWEQLTGEKAVLINGQAE